MIKVKYSITLGYLCLSIFYRGVNYYIHEIDSVAEWLRRETRNLMGFSRAGSNPAAVVNFFFAIN